MSTALVIAASAAHKEGATLFVGFELSKSTWLIGLYAPELGTTVSRYKVDGGDLGRAQALIETAKQRLEKADKPVRVVSIYEAGYDGFWLHRALRMAGVENRVIDAASMPVDRRARRVKTDRLDRPSLPMAHCRRGRLVPSSNASCPLEAGLWSRPSLWSNRR